MATAFIMPSDPTAPFYEYVVPLDGVDFRFRFKFNARDSAWYFDLFDESSGTLLRAGLRVVTGWDPMRLMVDGGRPAGDFYVLSEGDAAREADTVAALGEDVVFYYVGQA